MFDRIFRFNALLLVGLLTGCAQDGAVPSDPGNDFTAGVQSETSMVRAITASGSSRLIVGYNDVVEQVDAMGNYRTDYSFSGLSISDDGGVTWERRGQLPAGTADVPALRGDPWLAAAGELVLYVSLRGPPGGGPTPPGPNGVVLAVSTDGAESWDAIEPVYEGPADGPKVALAADGSIALIVWMEQIGSYRRTRYLVVRDPSSLPLDVEGPYDLDEVMGWRPPSEDGYVPFCYSDDPDPAARYKQAFTQPHPVVAIGPSGAWYLARVVQYQNNEYPFCNDYFRHDLEVFRSNDEGASWDRIHSSSAPQRDGRMLGIGRATRDGTRPAMAVTSLDGKDHVLLALEQQSEGRQNIEILRIPGAAACVTDNRHFSSEGAEPCPYTETYPHETLWFEYEGEEYYVIESPDHYAYQPALFTGNTLSEPDPRVGLFFYVQPHRGDPEASASEQRFTTVVGLVSFDGAQTWGKGAGLTIPIEGRPTIYEDTYEGHKGTVFIPCPSDSGYFGDYNGGAFVADIGQEEEDLAVAAWADSREGCLQQGEIHETFYQKVFSARFSPQANP